MTLVRRLVITIAFLLSILIAGLLVFFYNNLQNAFVAAEERSITAIENSFQAELALRQQTALALATTAADNPAIQQAFAKRDRAALSELVTPGYLALQETNAHVIANRFFAADGLLLFDADSSSSNDQVSEFPAMLADNQRVAAAGLDVEGGKLIVRGVAPSFYQGAYLGIIEYQIGIDASTLTGLQKTYDTDWSILLSKDLAPNATAESVLDGALLIVARTSGASITNTPENYANALRGSFAITHPHQGNLSYALLSAPLYDFSGKIIGVVDILHNHTHLSAILFQRIVFVATVSIVLLLLTLAWLYLTIHRMLQPIHTLTVAASELSEGAAIPYIPVTARSGEIGVLVDAFNRMAAQIKNAIATLEQRVAERTRHVEDQSHRLRIAAEISQTVTAEKRLDRMLRKSAQLIFERFDYYHVGVYILSVDNREAILAAEAGEISSSPQKHRIQVGDINIVGRVASTGELQVVSEAWTAASWMANSFLPKTRSEFVLPLKAEDRVVGILDIHSAEERAFNQEDISMMSVLAGQLGSAVERTRLLEESTNTLNELERVYGQFTGTGWQKFLASGSLRNVGYTFDNVRIEPISNLPAAGKQALASEDQVLVDEAGERNEVAIPIKFRGQTIGVVHAKLQPGYGEKAIALLNLAIERLASSLESARLYEEARVRASREQMISQVTTAIGMSSDFETILRAAVREIGQALPDTEVSIQVLGDADATSENEETN